MRVLFGLVGFLLPFCEVLVAALQSETFEKFYTADASYTSTGTQHHSGMGISTLAKFSMLSNTPTLFKVKRPGLNNDVNTVSLESLQKPGIYLRFKNYKFHMEKDDGTELFKKDATYREKLGPRGRAYELIGRDNWFMCHADTTPFTLKAISERIGTQDFVNNCVYVPVKQDMAEKKNIVKTFPTGGAMVVNDVPTTENTDKCISVRFVNDLGGPVRVVSSLKPEGYLVTANAFKLKTIFKHANHKQRHVIFYAENVQDRDDDVMLNNNNVYTTKPQGCSDDFTNVVLSSQSNNDKSSSAVTSLTSGSNGDLSTPSPANVLNAPVPPSNATASNPPNTLTKLSDASPTSPEPPTAPSKLSGASDSSPKLSDASPIPPAHPSTSQNSPSISRTTPTPQETAPATSGATVAGPPPVLKDEKPTAQNSGVTSTGSNPNVPASELAMSSPEYHATPNPNPLSRATLSPKPTVTAYEIGAVAKAPSPAWVTPGPSRSTQSSYTAPFQAQIQKLDNVIDVLHKRIDTHPKPLFGGSFPSSTRQNNGYSPQTSARGDGYEQWSSYGPCSVTCGVGSRVRSRVCRPGSYCYGPASESRVCIKEQCASNCIHTTGGTVREGSCCHFPFSYNGAQYYHCILSPKNNERMWCSTTPYFEQDKQWGYCPRSAKAPPRTFVEPVKPVIPDQVPSQSSLSSYDNSQYYNNPYTTQDDSNAPCSAMCLRVCDSTCPRRCCIAIRDELPFTAYMGSNYDKNDKRSKVYQYHRRYRRNL